MAENVSKKWRQWLNRSGYSMAKTMKRKLAVCEEK
jgi:hypothetical protein